VKTFGTNFICVYSCLAFFFDFISTISGPSGIGSRCPPWFALGSEARDELGRVVWGLMSVFWLRFCIGLKLGLDFRWLLK
jgi:hypothetical protein